MYIYIYIYIYIYSDPTITTLYTLARHERAWMVCEALAWMVAYNVYVLQYALSGRSHVPRWCHNVELAWMVAYNVYALSGCSHGPRWCHKAKANGT